MRNAKIPAAILISLAFLLPGCLMTFGLPTLEPPPTPPKQVKFFLYGSSDSNPWTKTLLEFTPEVYTSLKDMDSQKENFVIVRGISYHNQYINAPLSLGGITLFIVPAFGYDSYTADFEVYLAKNREHGPIKFHYEFSSILVMWIPAAIVADKNEMTKHIRKLYRQFFADYKKLMGTSKIVGGDHE